MEYLIKKYKLTFFRFFVLLIILPPLLISTLNKFDTQSSTNDIYNRKKKTFDTLDNNFKNMDNNKNTLYETKTLYDNTKKIPLLNDYYKGIFEVFSLIEKNNLIEIETSINEYTIYNPDYISHIVNIKIVGSLNDILNLIRDINNMNYFNEILSIHISSDNAVDETQLILNIKIQFLGSKGTLKYFNDININNSNENIFYIEKE